MAIITNLKRFGKILITSATVALSIPDNKPKLAFFAGI
jgi:hypothetical protein